jgi:hypothetical protein
MRNYFELQYNRCLRHLQAFGIHPYVGLLVILVLFPVLSNVIYTRLISLPFRYSVYLYALLSVTTAYPLGAKKRNLFLKTIFPPKHYVRLRLVENSLVALPFCIFLLCVQQFLPALAAGLGCTLLVLVRSGNVSAVSIPTPFSKHPFEFAVGFRQTYLLIIGIYLIAGVGIVVGNDNLGLVALLFLFLILLNYYAEPEPVFYVWTHVHNPHQFVRMKVKQALVHSLMLAFPLALALILGRISNLYLVLLILFVGGTYLLTWVLGKYAVFPERANFPHVLKLILGFVFPPLLFILIPHFYTKAIQRLAVYLK